MDRHHLCPDCGGLGKQVAMFPRYAPGTPASEKRRVIELKCPLCGGRGEIDDATKRRREKGALLRKERLDRGMGLRQEAERLGISASELSKREQGI